MADDRARAKLRGERGTRGLIHLSADGGGFRRELDLELDGRRTAEVVARMLPAASLEATLQCSDAWDLPDTVAVRVYEARSFEPATVDPGGSVEPGPEVRFTANERLLAGRRRDRLAIGPFEQGVYHLVLRPAGFDRWTWAFEAHDPTEAARLQVDVVESEAALGEVDLGIFQVECGPAVDLLPAVAGGAAFPDGREVGVEASFLDLDTGKEVAGRRVSIVRRQDRILLRGVPGGRLRLDLTLRHPHFLPEPALGWQIEMELERGDFREIVPEIVALGGAVVISGTGGTASLHGPQGEIRRVDFRDGEAELPSLVPGRYRLEVSGTAGESMRIWPDIEIVSGQTLRLALR